MLKSSGCFCELACTDSWESSGDGGAHPEHKSLSVHIKSNNCHNAVRKSDVICVKSFKANPREWSQFMTIYHITDQITDRAIGHFFKPVPEILKSQELLNLNILRFRSSPWAHRPARNPERSAAHTFHYNDATALKLRHEKTRARRKRVKSANKTSECVRLNAKPTANELSRRAQSMSAAIRSFCPYVPRMGPTMRSPLSANQAASGQNRPDAFVGHYSETRSAHFCFNCASSANTKCAPLRLESWEAVRNGEHCTLCQCEAVSWSLP